MEALASPKLRGVGGRRASRHGSGGVAFVVGGVVQVDFNDFARSLLRNRGVLKMDKRGTFVNGPASLVALLQQTRRRRFHDEITPGGSLNGVSCH